MKPSQNQKSEREKISLFLNALFSASLKGRQRIHCFYPSYLYLAIFSTTQFDLSDTVFPLPNTVFPLPFSSFQSFSGFFCNFLFSIVLIKVRNGCWWDSGVLVRFGGQ